jgi:hypothetical protein
MNVFKKIVAIPVLLVAAAFGYQFYIGIQPIETINWGVELVLLVVTCLFCKVGWGLMTGKKMQRSGLKGVSKAD